MTRLAEFTHATRTGFAGAVAAFALALSMFLSVAPSARAADFETALAYFKDNQWLPAFLDFQILAADGDARAQAYIGMMYRRGLGIATDYTEAERWLRASAEQGNDMGNHRLGWMYARGEIAGDRDFANAVKYWKLSAEQGNHQAQMDLGVMYWRGEGVPQDFVMAYTWLDLAADDETLTAAKSNQDALAQTMTPEQIEEGQKLAGALRKDLASNM